jgi:hypothetical protein
MRVSVNTRVVKTAASLLASKALRHFGYAGQILCGLAVVVYPMVTVGVAFWAVNRAASSTPGGITSLTVTRVVCGTPTVRDMVR